MEWSSFKNAKKRSHWRNRTVTIPPDHPVNQNPQSMMISTLEGKVTDFPFTTFTTKKQYKLNKIKNDCKDILILDGLQRTYTLIDASAEMEQESPEDYQKFLNHKLRLEIYVDINKFGVLYRMLTLNTGQTPMAARHQLEMLYRDKLNTSIEGVKLITDVQGKADPEDNEFIFKNVIDGFNSYMNRNELPIDRQELLENIQMLENMSDEDVANDIFEEFLGIYVKVFNKLCNVSNNYYLTDDDKNTYEISDSPFGKSVSKVFSTSQAMTGFGAAIGRMKDNGTIKEIDEIEKNVRKTRRQYQ